jgi:RimJ/RimL family protein N-acetyltransferase
MPTYLQHVEFIESKPYEKWYIVLLDEKNIGSTYLSKNDEIGISLIEEMQGKGMGSRILELIIEKNPRNRYLANINPNNSSSVRFFEKNGFKLIQHTFEKINGD